MRWPRQIATLCLVAVLLVGPPLLLVRVVGWPWPEGGLRLVVWQWIRDPLTEQNLILMLVILGWLLWAFVAYTVTVRIATRMWAGVRWLRRLPLPTPWQATATGIAGAAALTIPTLGTPSANVDATPPTGSSGTPAPDEDERAGLDGGVTVAGGWLPREVADQVTAAAGLMWLRRRRAYLPGHPPQPGHPDADLTALPPTITAIQAHPTNLHPPATAGPPPTAALSKGLPPAGVGMVGPGALHAARGLLVTTLLTAIRADRQARVIISRDAVDVMLGPAATRLKPGPGLSIADDADHAATLLSPSTSTPDESATTATRTIMFLKDPPDRKLAVALTDSTATALVLEAWSDQSTWYVDTSGHTHDTLAPTTAGPRVCVLDPVATIDLLTVTGHTHPDTDPPPPPRIPRQPSPTRTETDQRLRVRVLGEPALLLDDTPLPVRRSAALHTIVLLAVHPDGTDSHHLAETLWPGLPAQRLTGRLRFPR
ncbi:hypothetical protein ABZ738_30435 [Micromonospora sp. NPDC047793]|uniref:hypothetical protein n=1 Tax=Micromonospora sp. NPDC047793 TaxID=3154342 RepID=UPI0033D7C7B2